MVCKVEIDVYFLECCLVGGGEEFEGEVCLMVLFYMFSGFFGEILVEYYEVYLEVYFDIDILMIEVNLIKCEVDIVVWGFNMLLDYLIGWCVGMYYMMFYVCKDLVD